MILFWPRRPRVCGGEPCRLDPCSPRRNAGMPCIRRERYLGVLSSRPVTYRKGSQMTATDIPAADPHRSSPGQCAPPNSLPSRTRRTFPRRLHNRGTRTSATGDARGAERDAHGSPNPHPHVPQLWERSGLPSPHCQPKISGASDGRVRKSSRTQRSWRGGQSIFISG